MSLADRFHARLKAACDESRSLGYPPNYFEQMLWNAGGVQTARRLVASGKLQTGFKELKKLGRLDLSAEQIMIEPEFRQLFSPSELAAAEWRLQRVRGAFERA